MEMLSRPLELLKNRKLSRWLSLCLILGEILLNGLIITNVSCMWRPQSTNKQLSDHFADTEIDWKAYMQQVKQFLDGERDYTLIKGDTGPLVYPAIHVYLYTALYYMTENGTNIFRAQCVFMLLYLVILAVVFACYRKAEVPPWMLIPLVLSKRVHSIFLLRLFNDTWATLFFWLSIWALQRKSYYAGAIYWSLGVGVKMTILLAAPAIGVLLLQALGTYDGIRAFVSAIATIQVISATPFLMHGNATSYMSRAFEFQRQFLYEWTVNWRGVDEQTFLSKEFAISLLVVHAALLLVFMDGKWVQPSSKGVFDFAKRTLQPILHKIDHPESEGIQGGPLAPERLTPTLVMDCMLGSMLIGLLCARSLHYQFFAYIHWATPYLLWRSGLGPLWILPNCLMQELAWLKFPSTNGSSSVVLIELALAVISLWFAKPEKPPNARSRPATTVEDIQS